MKFFLSCLLSSFVKESSALKRRGTRSPAPRRSIKHSGVNGKWPAQGRALGCPITATRRAAPAAPARRPASSQHPPSALGRISTGREAPPRARPRAGGGEPPGRGRPRDKLPSRSRNVLQQARGPTKQLCSFLTPPWSEQLTGCSQVFVCYRLLWEGIQV